MPKAKQIKKSKLQGDAVETRGKKNQYHTGEIAGRSPLTPLLELNDENCEYLPSSSVDDINKLEEEAIPTIQNNNGKWILKVSKIDVRRTLSEWQSKNNTLSTDLAWYDIIDITSTSSSRFIPSLPSTSIDEIKSFRSSPPLDIITDLNLKIHIVELVKEKDFCKAIDESYTKTRENNAMKFVWDFGNLLADSFERNNDLADIELSEFGYREFFFSPLIRSLFRGTHGEVKIYFGENGLFASSEERNLGKKDGENRDRGQKVDIIWKLNLTNLEFAVGEVSGPPNVLDNTHFFNDKIKIAKLLKVIINRIIRKYGGRSTFWNTIKVYGLQVYFNEIIIYEMAIPFHGLYIFREIIRTKIPNNSIEVGMMSRCVPIMLKFKELITESMIHLKEYITSVCTATPTEDENMPLFITRMIPREKSTKKKKI